MQETPSGIPAHTPTLQNATKRGAFSTAPSSSDDASPVSDATYDQPVQVSSKARLTPLELRAADMLLRGRSITRVAKKLGIARSTIYRWQRCDPHFIAYTNYRLNALTDSARVTTHRLLASALRAAESNLLEDPHNVSLQDALRVLSVLRANRFIGHPLEEDPGELALELGD